MVPSPTQSPQPSVALMSATDAFYVKVVTFLSEPVNNFVSMLPKTCQIVFDFSSNNLSSGVMNPFLARILHLHNCLTQTV